MAPATNATPKRSQSSPPVIADPALAAFLQQFEAGIADFMSGDPSRWKENLSGNNDIVIMGAWGDHEAGRTDVLARYDWAAARFQRWPAKIAFEYVSIWQSGDLAATATIERALVKVIGAAEPARMTLRVTHVFRREDGAWKLVIRHADPLTEKTAPGTVLDG